MQKKENKKIRNASSCIDGSIAFKSQLEKTIYNTLKQLNIDVKYEPVTYELYPGFIPLTPFYDKESDTQQKKRIKEGDKKQRLLLLLADAPATETLPVSAAVVSRTSRSTRASSQSETLSRSMFTSRHVHQPRSRLETSV